MLIITPTISGAISDSTGGIVGASASCDRSNFFTGKSRNNNRSGAVIGSAIAKLPVSIIAPAFENAVVDDASGALSGGNVGDS